MATDRTLEVQTFRPAGLTADKQNALIDFATSDGDLTLSIPEQKLGGLFALVCAAIEALAERTAGRRQTYVLETQGWDLAPLASGRLAVKLRLVDGVELTFAVPNADIAATIQALQKMQAETTPPPPDISRH